MISQNSQKGLIVLIGSDTKLSLSPIIHNYWIRKFNFIGYYKTINVLESELETIIFEMKNKKIMGANVTAPYKEKIIGYLDVIDGLSKKIGAVNTIYMGDKNKIYGTNTDLYGFKRSFKESYKETLSNKKILILGAGGAARSILLGLIELGCQRIILCNRTQNKSLNLQSIFKQSIIIEVIGWDSKNQYIRDSDILINTTNLGSKENDSLDVNLEYMKNSGFVYDIIYNPKKTTLLKNADKYGIRNTNGLNMLLYQASRSFSYWFNINPPDLDQYLIRDL